VKDTDNKLVMKFVSDIAELKTVVKHILANQHNCVIHDVEMRTNRLEPKVRMNRMLTLLNFTTFLSIIITGIIYITSKKGG